MSAAFRAKGAWGDSGGFATVPSGAVVGDMLLLFVLRSGNAAAETISGWTNRLHQTVNTGSNFSTLDVYSRVCVGGDAGTNAYQQVVGGHSVVLAYSGVKNNTIAATGSTASGSDNATVTQAAVTYTGAGVAVFFGAANTSFGTPALAATNLRANSNTDLSITGSPVLIGDDATSLSPSNSRAFSGGGQAPGIAVIVLADNSAPTAPTTLSPAGSVTIDRTATQRFSWTFTDPDAGDTQSKFDLQYRIGTGAWTTVTQTTTSQFYDFAGSTFSAASYEWQVRCYDALGVVGPYSASAFFTAASPPTVPTITSPISGSTQGTQAGTVTWSAPAQDSYEVRRVADIAGAADTSTVYYDSAEVGSSTARTAALTFLTNGRTEHLEVRIKLSGLWSTWADVRVVVSYTPPATPTLTATPTSTAAPTFGTDSIIVAFTDPTPTGSQPTVTSHDVYRRKAADGTSGTRLAAAVGGTSWTDRTPGSLTAYEYQLVANGSNGTSTASAWTA